MSSPAAQTLLSSRAVRTSSRECRAAWSSRRASASSSRNSAGIVALACSSTLSRTSSRILCSRLFADTVGASTRVLTVCSVIWLNVPRRVLTARRTRRAVVTSSGASKTYAAAAPSVIWPQTSMSTSPMSSMLSSNAFRASAGDLAALGGVAPQCVRRQVPRTLGSA
jgi:hypothetical protein